MTLKEKVICTAYTGINFCFSDDLIKFREYADALTGRPTQDIDMIYQSFWNELHEKSEPDFMDVLRGKYAGGAE